jgi:multiple sugar transport system permease protein
LDKYLPLVWVFGITLAYLAAGYWYITARDALRRGLGAGAAVALLLSLASLGYAIFGGPLEPKRIFAASFVAVAILFIYQAIVPAPKPHHKKLRNEDTRQTYLHLVLLTGTIIFMVPFVWLVSTSLKDDEDIFTTQIRMIPQRPVEMTFNGKPLVVVTVDGASPAPNQETVGDVLGKKGENAPLWAKVVDNEDTVSVAPVLAGNTLGPVRKVNPDAVTKVKKLGAVWENYPDSLKYLPEETHHGLIYLMNTLIITVLSIIGTLLTASMVAFSFARLRWPGKDALFVLLLSTMMLPYAVTMIPQFLIWEQLGFFNTLVPLWAGAFMGGGAFNIFLLRQFFMTIPSELEEAAKIDGCTYWRTFWTIMLPLVRPAMATVAIFTFMGAWNNFMGPLIYVSSPTKMPVAYALQLYQSVHGGEFGYLMAASTMVMLPVLLVFFFCQRYFIQGITLTGLKG